MILRHARLLHSACALTVGLVVGCADPHGGRMEVSGSVKVQGQPLKDAAIRFVPLDKQDTEGGGPVTAGEYRIPKPIGLKPGHYLVQITAGDGKTTANEEAGAPGGSTNIVSFELIPEEWNVKSKQKRAVTASGPNRFDFEIPNFNTPRKKR